MNAKSIQMTWLNDLLEKIVRNQIAKVDNQL